LQTGLTNCILTGDSTKRSGYLIRWFEKARILPKKVFITHGEPSAADDLRRRLTEKFSWNCTTPSQGESEILEC
jgi:metallo-beta-lactamase family protein